MSESKPSTAAVGAAREPLAGPHFPFAGSKPVPRPAETRGVCLAARGLCKSYRKGAVDVPVLRGVDLAVRPQEFLAVVGQSGSGKTTLLHLLATLDTPDRGEIHWGGRRIDNLPTRQRDRLRNGEIGIVFQFYHLLPELTTLENVLLPAMIGSSSTAYWGRRRSCRIRALDLLEMVGLSHRLRHRPRELSGGEMQRVAIARSLMNQPQLLLADEPTGNLDRQTGTQILQLLKSLNADHKLTIVMVTHDTLIAQQAHRVVRLVEGRVVQGDGGSRAECRSA